MGVLLRLLILLMATKNLKGQPAVGCCYYMSHSVDDTQDFWTAINSTSYKLGEKQKLQMAESKWVTNWGEKKHLAKYGL